MASESDLIRRYEGAFSKEDCDEIIEDIKYFENHNLLYYNKSGLDKEDHETLNVAENYDVDLPTCSRIVSSIIPKFKPCIDEYLESFSVLGRCKFLVYDCKLKKIPEGGGFHNWHFENSELQYGQRHLVLQLYLNDEFDGGETEFLYQHRREKAKKGDVLIFPCSFTHTHRGNPPLGGTKYIATSWAWMQQSDEGGY